MEAAGGFSKGSTAYLNMEPGDCHGDQSAVSALVQIRQELQELWLESDILCSIFMGMLYAH